METVRMNKKKAGRPAKEVKKEIRACVRFTRNEYFIIQEKAARAGMKVSAYIRQVGIYAVVHPRLTEEQRQNVRDLVGLSNNFNQLAKACHREGILPAMAYFESYRDKADELIEKLRS